MRRRDIIDSMTLLLFARPYLSDWVMPSEDGWKSFTLPLMSEFFFPKVALGLSLYFCIFGQCFSVLAAPETVNFDHRVLFGAPYLNIFILSIPGKNPSSDVAAVIFRRKQRAPRNKYLSFDQEALASLSSSWCICSCCLCGRCCERKRDWVLIEPNNSGIKASWWGTWERHREGDLYYILSLIPQLPPLVLNWMSCSSDHSLIKAPFPLHLQHPLSTHPANVLAIKLPREDKGFNGKMI